MANKILKGLLIGSILFTVNNSFGNSDITAHNSSIAARTTFPALRYPQITVLITEGNHSYLVDREDFESLLQGKYWLLDILKEKCEQLRATVDNARGLHTNVEQALKKLQPMLNQLIEKLSEIPVEGVNSAQIHDDLKIKFENIKKICIFDGCDDN